MEDREGTGDGRLGGRVGAGDGRLGRREAEMEDRG